MPFALPVLTFAWKVGLTAGIVAFLVGSCMLRDQSLRNAGAEKAVAKIEKATKHAVEKGKRAADRSGAPGMRGVVDPTTRHD